MIETHWVDVYEYILEIVKLQRISFKFEYFWHWKKRFVFFLLNLQLEYLIQNKVETFHQNSDFEFVWVWFWFEIKRWEEFFDCNRNSIDLMRRSVNDSNGTNIFISHIEKRLFIVDWILWKRFNLFVREMRQMSDDIIQFHAID